MIGGPVLFLGNRPAISHKFPNNVRVALASITHGERLKCRFGTVWQEVLFKSCGKLVPQDWKSARQLEFPGLYGAKSVGLVFKVTTPKNIYSDVPELLLVDPSGFEILCTSSERFGPLGSAPPRPNTSVAHIYGEPKPLFGTDPHRTVLWALPPSKESKLHLRFYSPRRSTNSFDFWIANPTR